MLGNVLGPAAHVFTADFFPDVPRVRGFPQARGLGQAAAALALFLLAWNAVRVRARRAAAAEISLSQVYYAVSRTGKGYRMCVSSRVDDGR